MSIAVRAKRGSQRELLRDRLFLFVNLCLVILVLLTMLYPIYVIIISSFSDPNLVAAGKITLYPKGLNVIGYKAILESKRIWNSYLNSIIYTVASTAISLVVTMGAAFALSRKFPGKKIFSVFFIITMFFNGGLIPTFLTVKNLGFYNTPWICILMGSFSVWNTMLTRTYITSTIPEALYEAANLDGATKLQYFVQIVLPLSGTIIAVLCVYYGVAKWNDFWTGLVYISKEQYLPLQTVLKSILATLSAVTFETGLVLTSEQVIEYRNRAELAKYCVIIITTGPAIALYLGMQKFFAKGVMIGSLKG